jgi:nucleoside-diphosphate kinase
MSQAPSMDRTLLVVKPDGVARGLVGKILSRLEEKGLFIVAAKMLRLDERSARVLYSVHKGKPFYEPLITYITSGPVLAVVLEGKGVIEMVRLMAGATFGCSAAPGTIRGDFGVSKRLNLIHASDSAESFERERPVFFADSEIMPLDVSRVKWIYDAQDGGIL